jgi:hypothetical protein
MDGTIIGMSHRKQGQIFAIDTKSGATIWTSPGKMADNAALIGNRQAILILADDGELQIISPNQNNFAVIKTYFVSSTPTWAHPVPVQSGLLIKNQDHLIRLDYTGNSQASAHSSGRISSD